LVALQDALADKDWSVRAAAAHAIAVRNNPALEKDLLPPFEDKNEAVRVRAGRGLPAAGRFGQDFDTIRPAKSG